LLRKTKFRISDCNMNIFRNFEDAANIRNPVVTTGSFDGVHVGHKTILGRLQLLSRRHDGESVLITFDPHPKKVLYPDTIGKDLKLINTQEEKLELLRKTGLDNVIIVEFTEEFSKISSEQFVRDFLHGILNAKIIVVGFNHHFGYNKEGDYRQLWEWREKYNFEAEEIPEQEVQHEAVSSTRIRQAINEGNIQRANAYLDHYYIIMGKPERFPDTGLIDSIPFLKIPTTEESKLLPAHGIYAVSADIGSRIFRGMVLIHQTNHVEKEVLLHLFNNENRQIDQKTTIFFLKKISGSVDLNDISSATFKLKSAKEEISDLIY
jgi:riboflavin kinase / FMN adenylyltransferase